MSWDRVNQVWDQIVCFLKQRVNSVIQAFKEAWRKLCSKQILKICNFLSGNLKMESVSQAIAKLANISCDDSDIWDEVLQPLQRQLDMYGVDLFVKFLDIINRCQTPLYSFVKCVAQQVLNTATKLSDFIYKVKKLYSYNPDTLSSVFFSIRLALKDLLEANQYEDVSRHFDLIKKLGLLTLTQESSLKNGQIILEQGLKAALHRNDLSSFERSLSVLDSMKVKPCDVFFNKLLDTICKQRSGAKFSEAILSTMTRNKVKASLITFNTLLDLYMRQNNISMADYLFESLCKNRDPEPDHFTFCIMISGVKYMHPPSVERAQRLYKLYQERLPVDLIIVNCLLDVYVSIGHTRLGLELLTVARETYGLKPDGVTYNTLIKACSRVGDLTQANKLFQQMQDEGVEPTRITFNSMMGLNIKTSGLSSALEYMKKMREKGISPDQFSYSILFNGLKEHSIDRKAYDQVLSSILGLTESGEVVADEVFFNSLMDVSVKFKDLASTEMLFNLMKRKGIKPSSISYGILIKAYGRANIIEKVVSTFEQMSQDGLEPNDVTMGCLIEAYITNGEISEAERFFRSLPSRKIKINAVLLSTMIKGYSKNFKYSQAIKLWEDVTQDSSFKPNLVCYNCMIDVAVRKQNMLLAQHYLTDLKDCGFLPDFITYSVLIKGLCQEKSISQALNLLEQMKVEGINPDIATFNLILDGSADFKHSHLGFKAYEILKNANCKPSPATFGSLAKLYGYAKQPWEAMNLIDEMKSHNIIPSLIFFTHLIHIAFVCGETQMADQVLEIMRQRKIEMDEVCWNKVVGGYARNRDMKRALVLAEQAQKKGIRIKDEILDKMIEKMSSLGKKWNRELNTLKNLKQTFHQTTVLAKADTNKSQYKKPDLKFERAHQEPEHKENTYQQNHKQSHHHNQGKEVYFVMKEPSELGKQAGFTKCQQQIPQQSRVPARRAENLR